MRRYFVGLFLILLLIILVVVLLSSGPKKAKPPTILPSYASSDASVSMTIDGPITAESTHQSVQITVDNLTVSYQQFNGYENTLVNSKTYPNNEPAYSAFLWALYRGGYMLGDKNPAHANDQGYCPLGERYVFTINQDGNTIERYWTTSCGSPRTYNGNFSLTFTLFIDQVPDYSALTQNVRID